jgi:hypothetical protein
VDSVEWIGRPGFDYQPGWFISGIDLDKDEHRSFALTHIVLTVSGTSEIMNLLELN